MISKTQIFWYPVTFTTLLRATDQSFTLEIQSDADFEVQKIMSTTAQQLTDVGASDDVAYMSVFYGQHFNGLEVQVTNLNSGEKWSNIPVAIPCMFGDAMEPMVLPQTKILGRSSSLQFQVYNRYTGVDFASVSFVLYGRKLYN